MRKLTIMSLLLVLLGVNAYKAMAQDDQRTWGTITTAVPFLLIGPDARSGAMGDVGVATTPDGNSLFWNASKMAFLQKSIGFNVSYVPWLQGIADDIGLAYVSGYGKIGDLQTVGASLRYFSLGDITFVNDQGESPITVRPNEFVVDLAYSRKLGKKFSAAVVGKFIYSNLTQGQTGSSGQETIPGKSVAADISIYYHDDLNFSMGRKGSWAVGASINNIGNKMAYTSSTNRDFIPTNLRVGGSFNMDLDDYNALSINADINKLLVPTPPVYEEDGKTIKPPYQDNKVSVMQGMIQSFYDAPFKEEMQEFNYSVGVEYWYDKQFALRGGYFHENPHKGNREFFTLGAGLRYNVFGLDFSYLIANNPQNPLKNTLRFTLSYELD